MTEDYVSFEIAQLLKEKGFDLCYEFQYINCSSGYPFLTDIRDDAGCYYKNSEIGQDEYSAPTLQMAMKWLRKIKGCPIEILWHWDSDNQCEEWYFRHHVELKEQPQIEYFDEPEQAAEAAIKYCLENLI